MSKLGKMLLWIALVGAIVAVGAGTALVFKYKETRTDLDQAQVAKAASDKAAAQAAKETASIAQAKADTDKQLADTKGQITDLNTQLVGAKKQAADATDALAKANEAAKTAQDNYDTIKKTLNGKTADELVAAEAKAETDLTAAKSEQKILQDSLQASQTQIADLKDAISRSKTGQMAPGVSGKITFVDRAWNFVILDVGFSNGVVPNGELIVYRGRNFLGKIKVTKVDSNDAVAEILPDIKGDIQVGDSVLN